MSARCRFSSVVWLAALLSIILTVPVLAGYTPDPNATRDQIPTAYQWHPTDIFTDNTAWEAEMTAVAADIPKLTEYQGRLGESAATLLEVNKVSEDLVNRFYKLYMYAQTKYDVNQGDSAARTMDGRVKAMLPAYGEATSWIEPELLEIDPARIEQFMAEEPELRIYEYYFSELWRQQSHSR
mgnify:CR=1 FL=1